MQQITSFCSLAVCWSCYLKYTTCKLLHYLTKKGVTNGSKTWMSLNNFRESSFQFRKLFQRTHEKEEEKNIQAITVFESFSPLKLVSLIKLWRCEAFSLNYLLNEKLTENIHFEDCLLDSIAHQFICSTTNEILSIVLSRWSKHQIWRCYVAILGCLQVDWRKTNYKKNSIHIRFQILINSW